MASILRAHGSSTVKAQVQAVQTALGYLSVHFKAYII
jgi:hypothetical protein